MERYRREEKECLSAIERILLEYDEIESNPSNNFTCIKLDWNPYEWVFAVRGAVGTEFEGGIYHGRVLFSGEYPFEPPSIIPLTENGRFKTHIKIWYKRLNLWQPSWRVRDVLVDFIRLMPTCPDDELCSLECNMEERRALAIKSRAAPPRYGSFARRQLVGQIHQSMLSKAPNGTGGVSVVHNVVGNIFHEQNTPCQEGVVVDRVVSTQMEWDRGVIAEDKCNINNSGEKQILEEYNEIESNPSEDFKCLKLDWNPYEWQFAIRGPSGTEFEGGIYHGVIQFSKGYPSKPPSIMFLTKNGRLKIQTDISSRLLSNWQSQRSVRKALLALIDEMPTFPDVCDDLDSVKYNKEVRRALAIKSRAAAPKCGTPERQKLIDEIHEYMLSKAPPVPQLHVLKGQAATLKTMRLILNIASLLGLVAISRRIPIISNLLIFALCVLVWFGVLLRSV
ncbi:hypothetical protein ACE6H2_024890 [Prunus campanulata]